MVEYDLVRIGKIISDIDTFFTSLERFNVQKLKDLEDEKNFYAVSMVLFSILNRAIDLGEEIVSAHKLPVPVTYKDIFNHIRNAKIISSSLGKELSSLMYDRNLIAHEYQDFGPKEVYGVLTRIRAVQTFVTLTRKLVLEK